MATSPNHSAAHRYHRDRLYPRIFHLLVKSGLGFVQHDPQLDPHRCPADPGSLHLPQSQSIFKSGYLTRS